MKTLYMTSSPTGTYMKWDEKEFDGLNTANGFVNELKKDLGVQVSCLMIAATPDAYEMNDEMLGSFKERLQESGFDVCKMDILDQRNAYDQVEALNDYNLIILGGGHVPTENAFFSEIGLKERLENYDHVIMGISAGSMNMSDVVYAQPEMEGESIDPTYQRFISGLGLSHMMVLPHYNAVKNWWLDGKRLFEDITFPDSYGRVFYAITDGSYILIRDGKVILNGEIYKISEGHIYQMCKDEESFCISADN